MIDAHAAVERDEWRFEFSSPMTAHSENGFQSARTSRKAILKLPVLLITEHELKNQLGRETCNAGFGGASLSVQLNHF